MPLPDRSPQTFARGAARRPTWLERNEVAGGIRPRGRATPTGECLRALLRCCVAVLHLSYFGNVVKSAPEPRLDDALAAVSERVRLAVSEASDRLRALGIRHALVGGLAVGAYGAPRNTEDVDFLVGLEAFEGSGLVLTHRQGVPVKVGGVAVDLLPAEEPCFERALDDAQRASSAVPIVAMPVLVQMKLRALRPQDQEDVRRLLRAGADLGVIRAHLGAVEPALLSRLDYVIERA